MHGNSHCKGRRGGIGKEKKGRKELRKEKGSLMKEGRYKERMEVIISREERKIGRREEERRKEERKEGGKEGRKERRKGARKEGGKEEGRREEGW